MARLTEQQRRFLELYVFPGGISASALDLAVDSETSDAPTLEGRAQAVSAAVTATPPPAGASKTERDAMIAVTNRIRDAILPPLVKAMVAGAERDLEELRTLHNGILARIKADAEAKAEAEARAERGRILRAQIDSLTVANADPLAAGQIATLAAALTEGWSDPPSEDQLKHGEDGLPGLQEAVRQETEARDARQAARALLVKEVDDLAAPGADDKERAAIADLKSKARAALPEFPGVQVLADAQGPMKALRDLVDLTGKAIAARVERARVLREEIAGATVANADPLAAGQIATLAAALTEGWGDPPSEDQLKQGEDGLPALKEAARKEIEARDARQAARAQLVKEIGDLAAPGADDKETAAIEDLKSKARAALPEFPGVQALADAQGPMKALRDLIDFTRSAVAARALRRDEILALRNADPPAGLLLAEKALITTAKSEFPELDGAISADALALAEAALIKLNKLKADLALVMQNRKAEAARITAALSQANWGNGTLTAPPGAPAALIEAQRLKVAALKTDNAAFADPDAPDSWPLHELGAITSRAEAVIAALAEVPPALEAIRLAVEKVTQAEAAARSQIAATAVHTLSASQQSALTDRIPAATGLFTAQLAEADAAALALNGIASTARSLQRDLRALARRVAAVDILPPGASAAERKILADLKKAAVDALAQVEP